MTPNGRPSVHWNRPYPADLDATHWTASPPHLASSIPSTPPAWPAREAGRRQQRTRCADPSVHAHLRSADDTGRNSSPTASAAARRARAVIRAHRRTRWAPDDPGAGRNQPSQNRFLRHDLPAVRGFTGGRRRRGQGVQIQHPAAPGQRPTWSSSADTVNTSAIASLLCSILLGCGRPRPDPAAYRTPAAL